MKRFRELQKWWLCLSVGIGEKWSKKESASDWHQIRSPKGKIRIKFDQNHYHKSHLTDMGDYGLALLSGFTQRNGFTFVPQVTVTICTAKCLIPHSWFVLPCTTYDVTRNSMWSRAQPMTSCTVTVHSLWYHTMSLWHHVELQHHLWCRVEQTMTSCGAKHRLWCHLVNDIIE